MKLSGFLTKSWKFGNILFTQKTRENILNFRTKTKCCKNTLTYLKSNLNKVVFRIFIFSLISLLFFRGDICLSSDVAPGFEIQDLAGSSINYSGTLSSSSINIPTTADKNISEVLFKCPYQTPLTIRCQISIDGTTYFDLMPGEFIGWSVKGFKKQIKLKANQAAVSYQAIINYEQW